jgi:hypothetical protein
MEKRVFGLKRVNLHSQRADATHLHERLGYQLFRQMGIHAPRSVHAKVMINGTFKGLFAVTEAPDGRFVDARFPKGDDEGNMYKEAWPTKTDINYYKNLQKTNEGVVQPTKVVRFANALNGASGSAATQLVDQWMSIDYLIKLLAVDRAINNWDGPLTFYWGNPHNFNLYESQMFDKLWLIPWDLDNTFALFHWTEVLGAWDKPQSNCGLRVQGTNQYMPPACDKILRAVAGAGRDKYVAAINQLLAGPLNVTAMQASLDRWAAQIGPAVMMDVNGPGYPRWMTAVAGFRSDLAHIRQKTEAIRDNKDLLPYMLRVGQVNGFEGVAQLNFRMGVTASANTNSVAMHALNTQGALGGTNDVRLDFELRNSSDDAKGAHTQRASIRTIFNEPTVNLSQIRTLRFKAKANVARTLRVEIGSSKYKTVTSGPSPRFGWDVMVGPTAGTVTLDMSRLGLPVGAMSVGQSTGEILPEASGITFNAYPNGKGSNGLLPMGQSDKGWVEIDDVELLN